MSEDEESKDVISDLTKQHAPYKWPNHPREIEWKKNPSQSCMNFILSFYESSNTSVARKVRDLLTDGMSIEKTNEERMKIISNFAQWLHKADVNEYERWRNVFRWPYLGKSKQRPTTVDGETAKFIHKNAIFCGIPIENAVLQISETLVKFRGIPKVEAILILLLKCTTSHGVSISQDQWKLPADVEYIAEMYKIDIKYL